MRLYHLFTAGLVLALFALAAPAQYGPYGPPYRGEQPPPPRPSYTPNQHYPPPPPPPQARSGRHLWVYGQNGKLDFRQLDNRQWVEEASDGNYNYREVQRTPDYIQLIDTDRGVSVRLYADAMYSHGTGDPAWHWGQSGHWAG